MKLETKIYAVFGITASICAIVSAISSGIYLWQEGYSLLLCIAAMPVAGTLGACIGFCVVAGLAYAVASVMAKLTE